MRNYSIVLLFLLLPGFAIPQYNLDFGFNLGASNYLGEMGGRDNTKIDFSDINFSKTRFTTGVWVRKGLHSLVSVKANLLYIRIFGISSEAAKPSKELNVLHFRNDIFEISAQCEFNFIRITDLIKRGEIRTDFRAYLYAGAGVFYHNPKAFYAIEWVALHPLGTEGQRRILVENKKGKKKFKKPYSRIQPSIPFGLGFYFTLKRTWRLGWEIGWRETFTDYLDDVSTNYFDPDHPDFFTKKPLKLTPEEVEMAAVLSQRTDDPKDIQPAPEPGSPRGNPKYKDAYIFTVFNLGYVIRGDSDFENTQYRFRTRTKKRKSRAKF